MQYSLTDRLKELSLCARQLGKTGITDELIRQKIAKMNAEDYILVGYAGKQSKSESGIIFCPYLPEELSHEEYARRYLANKTFAIIKKEHANERYAGKKCEVLDSRDENGSRKHLLKIDIANSAKGFGPLFMPEWKEDWIDEKDISKFLKHDENGKVI